MKTAIIKLIILTSLYLTLCACGNKGDLYMPEKDKDKAPTEQKSK